MSGDWIEVPRVARTSSIALDPGAVVIGLRKIGKRAPVLHLMIGQRVATKLGWTEEALLRVRWSPKEPKLMLDGAPKTMARLYRLKLRKAGGLTLYVGELPPGVSRDPHPLTGGGIRGPGRSARAAELVARRYPAAWALRSQAERGLAA